MTSIDFLLEFISILIPTKFKLSVYGKQIFSSIKLSSFVFVQLSVGNSMVGRDDFCVSTKSIIEKYFVLFQSRYIRNVFLLLACYFEASYFIFISIFNYLKLSQNINETRYQDESKLLKFELSN